MRLALALDIKNTDFALGRTKIFFKAGKGQVLEELAESAEIEVGSADRAWLVPTPVPTAVPPAPATAMRYECTSRREKGVYGTN